MALSAKCVIRSVEWHQKREKSRSYYRFRSDGMAGASHKTKSVRVVADVLAFLTFVALSPLRFAPTMAESFDGRTWRPQWITIRARPRNGLSAVTSHTAVRGRYRAISTIACVAALLCLPALLDARVALATLATPFGDSSAAIPGALPVVTSISPASGPIAGGTSVTITGTTFINGATTVFFGATSATITSVTNTQIIATAPAGVVGTVDITVHTQFDGTSATSAADRFTYFAVPTVTALSPTSGPTAGGTAVTITGSNLTGATAVKFGTTSVASFVVVSATSITTSSPAGVAGAVDVTVTTPGGTSATSAADQFTYAAVPTVTAVSPLAGNSTGGTSVTVTGTNFSGATAVKFGATNATSFIVNSATSITATAPAFTVGGNFANGQVAILVTTAGGTSAINGATGVFNYDYTPTIASVGPSSGPTAGGTSVTITGANFLGTTAVRFGVTSATAFTVVSATSITATAPAGSAGVVDVGVTNAAASSSSSVADRFTYTAFLAPAVTNVSPSTGGVAAGATVTITGTNFTGATAVTFAGCGSSSCAATITGTPTATSITVTAPGAPLTSPANVIADVTVTTPGGTSSINASDRFTFIAPPTVTQVSPTTGVVSGGTLVTITGTNFTGVTGVAFQVSGAGPISASFTFVNSTTITATSPGSPRAPVCPSGCGLLAEITVTTAGGTSATSAADQLTYVVSAPTVTSIFPLGGPASGGTAVTLTGTGLSGVTSINFGGSSTTLSVSGTKTNGLAPTFTVISDTSITVASPSFGGAARGSVDITVTTPSGTSATSPADVFVIAPAPAVTGVSPAAGSPTGGTLVTITGTDFTTASSVLFGGTPATAFTVVSATTITATSPALALGTVDITVTTASGTSAVVPADRFISNVAVPAMGRWFMLVLALLLGSVGYLSLRRQSHATS